MPARPYFTVTPEAFEKNAGYKSTVHALDELIDNAVEANARQVCVILVVDQAERLTQIAVADDGDGMSPKLLQEAVCEKAGTHMDRQHGPGTPGKRKLGKYGVGLPKASISQCNRFTVWTWQKKGFKSAYRNGVDITDLRWIKEGAKVPDSRKEAPPEHFLECCGLEKVKSGTLVLWDRLDGITWARARWGDNAGLIPNLEFEVGRVYRYMIGGDSPELTITIHVVDEHFEHVEDPIPIRPNDPLYTLPGQVVPRSSTDDGEWPPDDPLFELYSPPAECSMTVALEPSRGKARKVTVSWKASLAKKRTFAQLGKAQAGNLPHGKHAAKNVGLSILREGREITLSDALAVPSEPRERWFGVEVDFPQELDAILGMTNNKQEYTRLESVLRHKPEEYQQDGESSQQCLDRIKREDNQLAICLMIAWRTREIWEDTKRRHLNMRVEVVKGERDGGPAPGETGEVPSPEGTAEGTASKADPRRDPVPPSERDRQKLREGMREELVKSGIPEAEADQIAARIVEKGLSYAIGSRSGLGSPFFNVANIKGTKFLELNEDHPIHKYLRSGIDDERSEEASALRERLGNAKITMLLMLEAWAAVETQALNPTEKRRLQVVREDWGRKLDHFVRQLEDRP